MLHDSVKIRVLMGTTAKVCEAERLQKHNCGRAGHDWYHTPGESGLKTIACHFETGIGNLIASPIWSSCSYRTVREAPQFIRYLHEHPHTYNQFHSCHNSRLQWMSTEATGNDRNYS